MNDKPQVAGAMTARIVVVIAANIVIPALAAGIALSLSSRSEAVSWVRAGGAGVLLVALLALMQAGAATALGIVHLHRPLPVALHLVTPALALVVGLFFCWMGVAEGFAAARFAPADMVLLLWSAVLGEASGPLQLGAAVAAIGAFGAAACGLASSSAGARDPRHGARGPLLVGMGLAGVLLAGWLAVESAAAGALASAIPAVAPEMRAQIAAGGVEQLLLAHRALLPVAGLATLLTAVAVAVAARRGAPVAGAALRDAAAAAAVLALVVGLVVGARAGLAAKHATITAPFRQQTHDSVQVPVSTSSQPLAPEMPLVALQRDDVRVDGERIGAVTDPQIASKLATALQARDNARRSERGGGALDDETRRHTEPPEKLEGGGRERLREAGPAAAPGTNARTEEERSRAGILGAIAQAGQPQAGVADGLEETRNGSQMEVALAMDASLPAPELQEAVGLLRRAGARRVRLIVDAETSRCADEACRRERRAVAALGPVADLIVLLASAKGAVPVIVGEPPARGLRRGLGPALGHVGRSLVLQANNERVVLTGSLAERLRRFKEAFPDERAITVSLSGFATYQELVATLDSIRARAAPDTHALSEGREPLFDAIHLVETALPEPTPAAADGTDGQDRPEGAVIGFPMPREEIKRVIDANKPHIKHCYEVALQRNENLEGKVVMTWTINVDGSVTAVGIKESTLDDPGVLNCIKTAIRRWRFPLPPNAGQLTVTYPFIFKST